MSLGDDLQELCCFKNCGAISVLTLTIDVYGTGDAHTYTCKEHLAETFVDMAVFSTNVLEQGKFYLLTKMREWEEEE